MRLSVFAGGFDLDAAHGVCGADGATEDDTLELLTGLVDKSMVIVRSGTDRTRYVVLETLRAFGRDRLRENGIDDRNATRHAQYYTELAERAAAAMHGPDERAWVERMLPDYDNLRAAFERASADQDIDLARRLVTSLPELAYLRLGYESAGWAERVVDHADRDHPLFAAAVGVPRGARGIAVSFLARDRWRPSRRAVFLAGAPGASRIPPTYSPTLLCMRAIRTSPWRTTRGGGPRPPRRRPDPAGVDPVLRRGVPRRAAHSPRRSGRCAGGGGSRGDDRQPDGAVDGPPCTWLGAQEVRA